MTTIFRFALPALLALGAQFPCAALAQSSPYPAPMNPAAAAPPLAYESAFSGYKPGQEPVLAGWKESNARVAEPLPGAGGHDAHAGHDMGGKKAPADEHAGHDMGGKKAVADEHAGHDMGGKKAVADEHAGHDMGDKKAVADEHAGHDMAKHHGGDKKPAPPIKKDPHQGHQHKE